MILMSLLCFQINAGRLLTFNCWIKVHWFSQAYKGGSITFPHNIDPSVFAMLEGFSSNKVKQKTYKN